MAKALIWCEVICCHCGGMAISSDFYSPETIRKLKAETKDWIRTEVGNLCPECQAKLKELENDKRRKKL